MSTNHEWLNLLEVSGPFLAVPVLRETFPQGLEELDTARSKRLRSAYEEWLDAIDANDADLDRLHAAWVDEVLHTALEADDSLLKPGKDVSASIVELPEHGTIIVPELVFIEPTRDGAVLAPIHVFPHDTDLSAAMRFHSTSDSRQGSGGLSCSPSERMVMHLRALKVPFGIVTNGERWMLVHAPTGQVSTFASWYARIWMQESVTLRAFTSLLGVRRFFAPEQERLTSLFSRSLEYQDEVTDALGNQVQRAVEVLVQALDRADQDRNRELLRDIKPQEIYEAGLTVMMRLVFLLAAEERGLLLLGEPRYDSFYAVSTLRMQLRAESDEILERRRSAWSRLLAVFRAVFGGIDHPTLRLPAMGGSLFDPDRFPFLEGRLKGTSWKQHRAEPLPIDDRTVLLLLDAIQTFEGRTLSYRALDVEQIGHVYEGLLERTVKRTAEVTLELDGTKSAQSPWVTLAELESARLDGAARLAELLQQRSGSSASRVRNDLARPVDEALADRLLTACHGDTALRDRIEPFGHLVRTDPWGYPLVYPAGAFIVTTGSDRRETGTHYTPKSLTEAIVAETLTPIAYVGPAQGTPRADWVLKSPAELLDLKICDPAMGSGAFLVQACRWLADRLVEAWALAEAHGHTVGIDGRVVAADADVEALPRDTEARTIVARRLIAERCLYGVDLNPLAVELAKLSIWLVTLAKGRPFGFLDHNLRCGDSLLGIHRLDQLTQLSMNPTAQGQLRLFGQNIEQAVREAIELRQRLREMPIRDIRDVEAMAHLDADARRRLAVPEGIADAFIGEVFASGGSGAALENALVSLTVQAGQAIDGDRDVLALMHRRSVAALSTDLPADKPARRPFHWPLEFPEVFAHERGGFDGMVGNPPFLGGQKITGVAGTAFRDWLVAHLAEGRRGSADLVAYFFLRVWSLLREGGGFGLLAVNTIAEGDTRQVGLEAMVGAGAVIHAAYPNEPWPGKAAVVTSRVHVHKGQWQGERSLLGRPVPFISAFLSDREEWSPKRLKANESLAFQGSIVLGMGFVLTHDEAQQMLYDDPKNADVIFPYINGDDLNSDPEQRPSRWVINFWDWPEAKAKTYTLPFKWLEEKVKADRLANNDKGAREKWWLFLRARSELYHAIGRGRHFERHPSGWNLEQKQFSRVLVCSEVTKHLAFAEIPNKYVMSANLDVFTDIKRFAVCQSSIHEVWARFYSSRLETRLKYSPGNAYETFAFPEIDERLRRLGDDLLHARRELMAADHIGLTKLYNRFHTETERDPGIEGLRALQREMDVAVARAYGWGDLDLQHGFHEVPYLPENDRVRFTISETARVEVLRRLSELNRERYEEEVAQGLHDKASTRSPKARPNEAHVSQGALSLGEPEADVSKSVPKSANRRRE